MKNLILNNLGLKLLALFLAFATWFYVVVELQKGTIEERQALQRILPYRIISKRLPVKLNLTGEPPEGYAVEYDKITIDPAECVMVGPRSLLEKLSSVKTRIIDISGHTRMFAKDVSIVPPMKGIDIKDRFIKVTIPISKVE